MKPQAFPKIAATVSYGYQYAFILLGKQQLNAGSVTVFLGIFDYILKHFDAPVKISEKQAVLVPADQELRFCQC